MRKLFLLSVLLSFAAVSSAQYRWEVGVNAGVANYLGDIGGYQKTRRDGPVDMRFERTNWALGAYGRFKVGKALSIHGGVMAARIAGADYLSTNPARAGRNLSFRNLLVEVAVRPELTIFYDNDVGGRGYYNPDFRLYAFAGAALLYHNPQGSFDGKEWHDLAPLRTEGQTKAYSNFVFAIPAGIGLNFTHKKKHRFGWEFGWRTTFTDYLDDVSTNYADPSQMSELGASLANRTSVELINRINNQSGSVDDLMKPQDFELNWNGENIHNPDAPTKRGDPTRNDSYLFTQFSYGYVIKGKSQFYKRKYSWIKKKRKAGRKTRAKF